MKKRNTMFVAGMLALALLASCKKENNTNQNLNGTDLLRANIEQTSNGSRSHVNGTTGEVGWNEGDQFLAVDANGDAYTFTLVRGEAGETEPMFRSYGSDNMASPFAAVYPATNSIEGTTATITLPATQTYAEGSFANGTNVMVGYQEGSEREVDFRNVLGGICLPLVGEGATVTRIVLTATNSNDYLCGTFTVDCSSEALALNHVNETGSNSVTLDCSANGGVVLNNTTPTNFYIMVPPGSLEGGFTMEAFAGSVSVLEQTVSTAPGVTRNTIKKANTNLSVSTVVPEGALRGVFTVNAQGGKIYFSKGTLRYNPARDIWRFADTQYDRLHTEPAGWANITNEYHPNYDGWIELFGWGCTGQLDTRSSSNQQYYRPYDTYYDPTDYGNYPQNTGVVYDEGNYGGAFYGPTGNYNLSVEHHSDFGVVPVENGAGYGWRMFSFAEVQYMMTYRPTRSGMRFAFVNVHGNIAVIILPDDWDPSLYPLQGTDTFGDDYVINEVSDEDWTNILEANGVMLMILPGGREGNTIYMGGDYALYWTSTASGDAQALCPLGRTGNLIEPWSRARSLGGVVRLVRDVPNP